MHRRSAQRLVAWLCLVAALFVGVAPGQGLVLCLEPDGTTALEVASEASRCGECKEVGSPDPTAVYEAVGGPTDCPCTDIPLGCEGLDAKVKPKPVELELDQFAMFPIAFVATVELSIGKPSADATHAPPRPESRLALIRSVVLLV